MKIRRRVAHGEPQPNTLRAPINMDEKLREYFLMLNNRVPIEFGIAPLKNIDALMTINPTNVCGFATDFDDDYFEVEPVDERMNEEIGRIGISYVGTLAEDGASPVVDRIGKLYYTIATPPSHPDSVTAFDSSNTKEEL